MANGRSSPGNVKCRRTSTNSKRRYSRQAREVRSSASGVDRSVVFPTTYPELVRLTAGTPAEVA